MKNKILQIGPYTAIGGVSIHISRLSELLKEFYVISFIDESPLSKSEQKIFNIRSKNLVQYLNLIKKADVVHIHTGVWWLRCFHIFISFLFRKKIIVTVHSLSNLRNSFSILITRMFLQLVHKTITVSAEIAKTIKPRKEYIMPAFLPPIMEKENRLPEEIIEIISQNTDNKIIVSNAFKLVLHNNEDLYGLDLMIDVARMVKKEEKNYKIIFVVASKNEKSDLLDTYQKTIRDEHLDRIITLIPYPISFVRLMVESDLVVRATNTDGDALTVREAIYFNRSIIASDVAKRPKEAILFKNRDSKDLFKKIKKTLESKAGIKTNSDKLNDYNQEYYQNYYNSILTL